MKLSADEIKSFLMKLAESPKVLGVFFDVDGSMLFSVVGEPEWSGDNINIRTTINGNPGMLETSGFQVSLSRLLNAPCEFADPRIFSGGPFAGFFKNEVPFDYGLMFVFPGGQVLALLDVSGPVGPSHPIT